MTSINARKKARAVLGVSVDADCGVIRQVYWTLAKKYHPDRNRSDKNLEARFKIIAEAYEILCSEKNAGRHGGWHNNSGLNDAYFGDESYRDWWMERYRDLK